MCSSVLREYCNRDTLLNTRDCLPEPVCRKILLKRAFEVYLSYWAAELTGDSLSDVDVTMQIFIRFEIENFDVNVSN